MQQLLSIDANKWSNGRSELLRSPAVEEFARKGNEIQGRTEIVGIDKVGKRPGTGKLWPSLDARFWCDL